MLSTEFQTKKSMGTYVYLPQEWTRVLEKLIQLKYYNVQKWQITFTLGLNAAKNNFYVEKGSSKSCLELNFLQKSQWAHMFISHWSGVKELERLILLKYYNVQKQQIRFTLRQNTAKNTDYMEKVFKLKLFRIKFPTKKSVGAYI